MQARENVIEDLVVIGEDDSVPAGFTAITSAFDDGKHKFCIFFTPFWSLYSFILFILQMTKLWGNIFFVLKFRPARQLLVLFAILC